MFVRLKNLGLNDPIPLDPSHALDHRHFLTIGLLYGLRESVCFLPCCLPSAVVRVLTHAPYSHPDEYANYPLVRPKQVKHLQKLYHIGHDKQLLSTPLFIIVEDI